MFMYMESIENKIYKRIMGKGYLWAFSDKDFWDIGSRGAARIALVRLVEKGKIRRIIRGLYDYPKFSKLLNKVFFICSSIAFDCVYRNKKPRTLQVRGL